MDNEGAYLTYKELLDKLFPSTYVSYKGTLTLSNKSTDTFDYVSTLILETGDIVAQGEFASAINALASSPDKLTVDDGADITNGKAFVFRTTETVDSLNILRASAMQTIDLYTGQWFNKRTYEGDSAIKYEGNNTHILHFPVPIIEITSLTVNEEGTPLEATRYNVFKSRALPDDRRNPRLKLVSATRNIYTNSRNFNSGVFNNLRLQTIEGSFGFLEPNGSTPDSIKWATARLVMKILTTDLENVGSGGQIKKEKVDIHEVEYFNDNSTQSIKGDMTGDEEVDRIIAMYKAPLAISGSDPLYRSIETFYNGYERIL